MPEGQIGKLRLYVANKAMNLWEYNMLKQWNTQINISPASEPKNKVKNTYEKILQHIIKNIYKIQACIDISRAQYLLIFQKYQEPNL